MEVAKGPKIDMPEPRSLRERLGEIGGDKISETGAAQKYNRVKERVGGFTERVKGGARSVKGAVEISVGALTREGRDAIKEAAGNKIDQMRERFLQAAERIRDNFEKDVQQIKETFRQRSQERFNKKMEAWLPEKGGNSEYRERLNLILANIGNGDPMETIPQVLDQIEELISEIKADGERQETSADRGGHQEEDTPEKAADDNAYYVDSQEGQQEESPETAEEATESGELADLKKQEEWLLGKLAEVRTKMQEAEKAIDEKERQTA